jgi:hypothetical protein
MQIKRDEFYNGSDLMIGAVLTLEDPFICGHVDEFTRDYYSTHGI